MGSAPSSITRLLHQSQEGNKVAFDELVPIVYDQLHKVDSRRLSAERSGHTLRTTEIELGPSGMVYKAANDTLYVASSDDNAVYQIPTATTANSPVTPPSCFKTWCTSTARST